MRALGSLLLLLAAGLAWLSVGDRMSPTALSVVELDGQLGFPLYALSAGVGLAMIAASALGRRPPGPRRAVRSPAPSMPVPDIAAGDDSQWVPAVVRAAQALRWPPGASLKLDAADGVPFELRLEGMPPAAEARSMTALVRFLASIPLPPRVRVSFHSSQGRVDSLHHKVRAAFRDRFPAESVQVLSQGEAVDVLFFAADPCWAARGRLFIDPP